MEELLEALEDVQNCRSAYNKAAEECEYDRGYFLHRESKRLEEAKQRFKEAFILAVKEIIKD